MEWEMCNYLDCESIVDNPIFTNFEVAVKNDFQAWKQTPVS